MRVWRYFVFGGSNIARCRGHELGGFFFLRWECRFVHSMFIFEGLELSHLWEVATYVWLPLLHLKGGILKDS